MDDIVRFKLSRRVALAVMAVDDFTDRALTGSQVQIKLLNENIKPICKNDGFFIFTDCESEMLELHATARTYNEEKITVNLHKLNPLNPVLKVRMKPNRNYIMPKEATTISGKAEAGAVVNIIRINEGDGLKLLYDFDNTDEASIIHIYNPSNLDLEGKPLAICTRDKEDYEIFSISEKLPGDMGKYKLNVLPGKRYKKASSAIYQVNSTRADEKGEYFVPISWKNLTNCTVTVQAVGSKNVCSKVEITQGRENIADLLD